MKSVCKALLSSGQLLCQLSKGCYPARWSCTLSSSYLRNTGDRNRNEVGKFRTRAILGYFFVCFTYDYLMCGNFENFHGVADGGGLGVCVWRVGFPPLSQLVQNYDLYGNPWFSSPVSEALCTPERLVTCCVFHRRGFMPQSSDQRENFTEPNYSPTMNFLQKYHRRDFVHTSVCIKKIYLYIWKEKRYW